MQKIFQNVCHMKKVLCQLKKDVCRLLAYIIMSVYYAMLLPLIALSNGVNRLAEYFKRIHNGLQTRVHFLLTT